MENQIIRKLTIVAIGLAVFSGIEVFAGTKSKKEYWAIRNVNLNSLGPIQRVKQHKKMTRLLIKLGALEKKPSFYGGSKFSYQKILNDLTQTVIPFCHADGSNEHCMFGGWPSVRSGRCNTPYSATGVAAAAQLGTTQYDSNHYCNSKRLFRCNPLVFGPGVDASLAGEGYESINGNGANASNYNAGICVDISGGFNGLSKKCQDASKHLDQVRKDNGMKPWRETDFFNSEKADEFKALQGVIADRCEANRDNINSDGMCDSLEDSLSLTATAARAGKLNGINLDQIMPHCVQEGKAEGASSCQKSEDESLAKLYGALEELKNEKNCKFSRVQAADTATGNSGVFEFSQCPLSIEGELAAGFSSEQKVSVNFRGQDGAFAGTVNVDLSPEMSKEEILEKMKKLGSGFIDACHLSGVTSCNHPSKDSMGAAVLAALKNVNGHKYSERFKDPTRRNRWRNREVRCGFSSIEMGVANGESQSVQVVEGRPESKTSASCSVQFTGELRDQLESDNFRNEAVNTTIEIKKGGKVMLIPVSLDSASVSGLADSIKGTEGFDEFCKGEAGPTAEELAESEKEQEESVESMREKFGLSADQHLTTQQREALVILQGVEDLTVEIDEFGGMTFNHPDIASVSDKLSSLFPGIYINRESGKSARLFPTPEVRVEFLAARSSTELTDAEKSMLASIEGTTVDNSVELFSGITRDPQGNLIFLTRDEAPLSPARLQTLERQLDGLEIKPHQDASDPSVIRSYVIREPEQVPLVAAGPGEPNERVPGSTTVSSAILNDFSHALSPDADGHKAVMRNGQVSRQVSSGETVKIEAVAAAPMQTEDGGFSISYELNIEGRSVDKASMVNLYLGDLRREASRKKCRLTPTSGETVRRQGSFSIVCPAQN